MDLEVECLNKEEKSETMLERNRLTAHSFNFPFQPYDIQVELMKVAYDCYENKKFALVESPTGTGKSLSLICSSLTWLIDHQRKVKADFESKKAELCSLIESLKLEEESSGDWLSIQTKRQDAIRKLVDINKELDRIIKFEQRSEARRHAKLHNVPLENYSALNNADVIDGSTKRKRENDENFYEDNTRLLSSQESQTTEDEDIEKKIKDKDEDQVRPKIYYASRTHSQLNQFINEIKRTKFVDIDVRPPIKVVPLASRANFCVNPQVLKLKDSNAINERCTEMQRETNADKKCPYMKTKQLSLLKEDILSSVQDIEDIVSRGRLVGSCPYYATRMAIPEAEVVVLPYNNLLHHETRKASSLDLKENIVIVDEAHNILETICSIHSAPITGQQLMGSHTIISRYFARFHNKLNPRNALMIKTIVQCLTALIKYLDNPKKHLREFECPRSVNIDDDNTLQCNDSKLNTSGRKKVDTSSQRHEEFMIDVMKFIGTAGIERFNIFKIIDYFNRSQLARKLLGFFWQDSTLDLTLDLYGLSKEQDTTLDHLTKDNGIKPGTKKRKFAKIDPKEKSEREQEQTNLEFLKTSNPTLGNQETYLSSYPIYTLVEFLRSLTNFAHDGKVLTNHTECDIQQSVLKFILLNPSSQFKQMAEEARSVVLAGGTMQPFSEFIDLLFNPLKISRERLTLFSCGHVVERDQLFVCTLSNGSTGKPLELSYKTRSSLEAIDEIGRTIQNLTNVVPGGMICFLPSYDYEHLCFNRWSQIGVIRNIETRSKQVFREPRQSNFLKPVLDEYSRIVEKTRGSPRGALLLCVVGGKMSEGINFNDDLGRCVVMVGLPYANIRSGELVQKMQYYDKTCKSENNSNAGQQYYENLCIKGINQSIGRAIRHRKDYAAIILLDRRYSTKTSIRKGLPEWMRQSLIDHVRFGPMFGQLKAFYNCVESKFKELPSK